MKILECMCRNVFEYRRKIFCMLRYDCTRTYASSSEDKKKRILFFGTDNFSLPSLKVLNESLKSNGVVSSLEVVTSFKAKQNPLRRYSQSEGIQIHDWPLQRTGIDRDFDLGVVVSFGHLIPEHLISLFQFGMLNVHASLLPKLRGAAPIVHAIRNGDTETGITIMKIRPKRFDVGEILTQRKVAITKHMLMPELHNQLAEIGASTLLHCIENLDHYYASLKIQDNTEASYAPKIDAQFAEIRWEEMSGKQVYDLFRSLFSYRPLTTWLGNEVVKIFKLHYTEPEADVETASGMGLKVGQIQYCRKRKSLRVGCRGDTTIEIEQLSIGGKKVMSAQDFNNGFLSKLEPTARVFRR